jgi:hypothetical protein
MTSVHGPHDRSVPFMTDTCLSKVSRGESNMPSHTDIKPVISGPSTRIPRPPPQSDCDIKPSPSKVAGIVSPRDFRREREALKKQYDLEKRNLDLEEVNRLLRMARPAVKVEPGVGEVKPDIRRLEGGSELTPLDLSLMEDSDDEDDIVFVREVKGGIAKPSITGMSHDSYVRTFVD